MNEAQPTSVAGPQSEPAAQHDRTRTARLSVASNGLLTVAKVVVAAMTGSVSVFAEAVNSAGDLIGSAVAYGSVRAADTPPDDSHTYGHGKFENLSGVFIALVISTGAVVAVREATVRLASHRSMSDTVPGIVVMAVSAAVNIGVSRRLIRIGRAVDSPALIADGRHLGTDVITSVAALAGLIATQLTHRYWIDPAVALSITLPIFWVAAQIARDSLLTLSDASLPPGEEKLLRDTLNADPRVLGYHKLRTRKAGSHRHVDVHVQIDDRHTFVEAHEFTEDIEDKLRATLPNLHPIIHTEPFEAEAKHQQEVGAAPVDPEAPPDRHDNQ